MTSKHLTSLYHPVLVWLSVCLPLLCSGRIISIADLHGDYARTVDILKHARLIDAQTMAWIGEDTTLVQTGDITDRGDDGKSIYELFIRLADEAKASNGTVINLLGNHEIMNMMGQLDYVSEGDYMKYGGSKERDKAWSPTGWLGRRLRKFPVVARSGRVLFVHAGLSVEFVSKSNGINDLNSKMRRAVATSTIPQLRSLRALLEDQGPVWTRAYAEGPEDEICADVQEVLRRTNALRMVVGHTVQQNFRVGTRCQGRVVLADTGISKIAYGGEPSYIEHDGQGGAVAVYPALRERVELARPPGSRFHEQQAPAILSAKENTGHTGAKRPVQTWRDAVAVQHKIWLGITVSMLVLILAAAWLCKRFGFLQHRNKKR
eukprot:TRINITY_DN15544_c0_g7_i1.p1 TRINITY_DN15544_c0_g7~~TRINITY_DN15544_c0_g7_i1.p1  ORF type:complete len:376 (-),score=27.30 TRINITY_DN15544_c0_g7_i1:61-1188(-)